MVKLIAILLLLSIVSFVVVKNITSQLVMLSKARAKSMATATVNECIIEIMKNAVQYSDLVTTIKDEANKITYLQANTMRMNDLAYNVSQMVQTSLEKKGEKGINIRLGAAFGNDLFAASGPMINVKTQLIGTVLAEFTSEFESSGINQTRHKIILVIKTSTKIILPSDSATIDVENRITLFEGIIVGNVPQYYINIPSNSPYLNLVPEG